MPMIADSASGVSITRAGAELVEEAVGDLERAAEHADVLAHHEHALVGAHLLAHAVGDRLQVGHGGHQAASCGEPAPGAVAVLEQRRLVGEHARRWRSRRRASAIASASSTAALDLGRDLLRAAPRRRRRAPRSRRSWRSIGSLACHSSILAVGTYFMSSCAAWPCMRMVTASIIVGPSPASARSRAWRTASNIASAVVAVGLDAREAVGGGALDGVDRELLVERRRVRVLVVLEHEDDRQLLHAGPVHGLVEVAAGGRAVAEPRERAALLAAQLERHRQPGGDQHHVGQHRDHADAAERAVAEVHVAVAPAGDAVRAAHVLGEDARAA